MKDDVAGSGVSRVRFSHVSPCHGTNTVVVSKQIAGGVVVVAASETKAVVLKKPRQVHEKGFTWVAEVTLSWFDFLFSRCSDRLQGHSGGVLLLQI